MKTVGCVAMTAGILTAGLVGYCLLNKDTKKSADRFINKVMDDTTAKISRMNNKVSNISNF